MKKCRITVVRKACYPDLMVQYENPIEHACDLEEGQVFIANGWQKDVYKRQRAERPAVIFAAHPVLDAEPAYFRLQAVLLPGHRRWSVQMCIRDSYGAWIVAACVCD